MRQESQVKPACWSRSAADDTKGLNNKQTPVLDIVHAIVVSSVYRPSSKAPSQLPNTLRHTLLQCRVWETYQHSQFESQHLDVDEIGITKLIVGQRGSIGSRPHSHALRRVCSLITISVVSAFGRDTRAAMAAESVSRMILDMASAC